MSITVNRKLHRQSPQRLMRGVAVIVCLLHLQIHAAAQSTANNNPVGQPQTAGDPKPLSSDERTELLNLIRTLQQRVEKLEAAQNANAATVITPPAPVTGGGIL